MIETAANTLDGWINWFCESGRDWGLWSDYSFWSMDFNIRSLLAIVMVALVCGAIGSMMVANRMAFFSDALAHCAFAGVALGLLIAVLSKIPVKGFMEWIFLIMVIFGIAIGLGIAWVREKTSLASDTVIGVFFAGAMGFGAMLMSATGARGFTLEDFLFGSPQSALATHLLLLIALVVITALFLYFNYNSLVFTSFNVSLARSRGVSVRLCNYLFIALLGLIINVCLQIVGALLINGLLIVPAATAANFSRNMRQLFWWSVGLCQLVGLGGIFLAWEISIPDPAQATPIKFGVSGTIVVLSVLLFFLSMIVGPSFRNRLRSAPHEPAQGLQA
jgi:zinc transport system permease protein